MTSAGRKTKSVTPKTRRSKRASGALRGAARRSATPRAAGDVGAFVAALEHPLKREIELVRRAIRDVDPRIAEGVKWNSVSFRTTEYFATVHLRSREELQLVFHRGAKAKDDARAMKIEAPAEMLRWLATDRCLVTLGTPKVVPQRLGALRELVRAWIAQM